MSAKTSQLQIRVSPEQKAALKRLAEAEGLSVSSYVLAQVLPSAQQELTRLLAKLPSAGAGAPGLLAELAALVRATPGEQLAEVLASPPIEELSPVLRNQVAAVVEEAAHAKGVASPPWVDRVRPLRRPLFGWTLPSLRPHQLRVTPVPFKRRGIFFDPASPRATPSAHPGPDRTPPQDAPEPLRRLGILAQALHDTELKVEFYFIGGAVVFHTFHGRPPTAHVSALFRPGQLTLDRVADLTQREGWPAGWLQEAIKEVLLGGLRPDRYLDLPGLSVFVPPLEYVLALKVVALRLEKGARALDDLRFVIRALNLISAAEAVAITTRYFSERQLPPDATPALEAIFAA